MSTDVANPQVSVDFLRSIYPLGPWLLTAISVDKLKIDSAVFTPATEPDAEGQVVAWLTMHRGRNLYYSVNEPIDTAHEKKKLEKTDVLRVCFLHVDVDPRSADAGTEDLAEHVRREQERILAQLHAFSPPPSYIVFSGGGFNALWRLTTPIDIAAGSPSPEETIRRAIDVERRNWQFELDFGTPDHCRDVCRILRLPGTINRPDPKKIAKGRMPALSRVVSSSDLVYDYAAFMATPVVATNQSRGESRVSENVRRVESLDHLRGVTDKLKIMISQGFDPDAEHGSTKSRSETLFYVCCELVRCGIENEVILGIITDSRFQISASVIDKGSSMQRYALRQISRARDKAENPRLAEMNDKYAVIANYGGRCMVMIDNISSSPSSSSSSSSSDSETRQITHGIEFMRKGEFFDANDHEKIEFVDRKGKTQAKGVASWWFDQKRRRQYDHVVFEPGLDTPGDLNLWRGFAVEPISGNDDLRYLEHMYENICCGDDENYDYLLKWMARVVQRPRTQSMVAPVLLSNAKGTGKSTFTTLFAKIFEPHSWIVDNIERLTGQFNAHLANCVFVVAEEAFDLKDKKHESVLQEMITGSMRSVEKKGVDVVRRPNYVHLMMTSNKERVVPAGDHERRYHVLNVSDRRLQDSVYFRAINSDFCLTDEISAPLRPGGGASNLLHRLMSVDISKFDVSKFPQTQALREQQEHNLSTENEWLLQKLETGVWMTGREKWIGPVIKSELYTNYAGYARLLNLSRVQPYRAWHAWLLKTLGDVRSEQLMLSSHERPMAFVFPSLDNCRSAYMKRRGWATYEWPRMLRSVDDEMIDQKRVF